MLDNRWFKLFFILVAGVVPLVIGAMAATANLIELTTLKINSDLVLGIGTALALIGSLAAFLFKYLSDSRMEMSLQRKELLYRTEERKRRETLIDLIEKQGNQADISKAIAEKLKSDEIDSYLESVKEKLESSFIFSEIEERREETRNRIYRELEALNKRGTVNLVLGVVTAVVGISVLMYFVVIDVNEYSTLAEFVMQFFPRLSIVVIVEVFSYFFLKLYKSSLDEIKYFQNEATNIENTFLAIDFARYHSDSKSIELCVERLLMTERNPILGVGQSTQQLKSAQIQEENTRISPDHLARIMEAMRRESQS